MATVMAATTTAARPAAGSGEIRPPAPVRGREHKVAVGAPAAIAQGRDPGQLETYVGSAAHELRVPLTSGTLAVHLAARRLDALLAEPPSPHTAPGACPDAAQDPGWGGGRAGPPGGGRAGPPGAVPVGQLAPLRTLLLQALDSLERLDRLVGDLADVARLRTGAPAPDLRVAPCDLAAVAREAVAEVRRLAPGRAIRLRAPARSVGPVLADADRIRQVVTNYLTNALRYSPADRPVEVRVGRRGRWARVAVRDEGPGVPAAERRRIWEPFGRADGAPPVAEGGRGGTGLALGLGLGLGLYVSKAIVEQHGGRVGLSSAPGEGATFWFALPVVGADGGNAGPARSDDGQFPSAAYEMVSASVAA